MTDHNILNQLSYVFHVSFPNLKTLQGSRVRFSYLFMHYLEVSYRNLMILLSEWFERDTEWLGNLDLSWSKDSDPFFFQILFVQIHPNASIFLSGSVAVKFFLMWMCKMKCPITFLSLSMLIWMMEIRHKLLFFLPFPMYCLFLQSSDGYLQHCCFLKFLSFCFLFFYGYTIGEIMFCCELVFFL